MRAARFSEWAALRDNRMDLVFTEQREQAQQVLPKPVRVAGAQLLNPVGERAQTGRDQAPEPDDRGRRVPLDPPSPALASVHECVLVAVQDQSSTGISDERIAAPQRAERAKRHRATDRVERNVLAISSELAYPRHEIFVAVVDRDTAKPRDRGAVAVP